MLSRTGTFMMETGAASDTGMVRDHNEDAFMARPDSGVWLVADGMGGHDAGDFASRTIAEEMLSIGLPTGPEDLNARFMERLHRAHDRIRQHATELGGVTIGATVVGLLIYEDSYACLWAGDSRIYRLRGGRLTQETLDHTEVRQLLEAGIISPDEAAHWPRRNVITRAIGVTEASQVDVINGPLMAGDMFLMCSDGLTEHNTDSDIAAALAAGETAQAVCDALVSQTLARGARDNVTVMVVRCHPAQEIEGQA